MKKVNIDGLNFELFLSFDKISNKIIELSRQLKSARIIGFTRTGKPKIFWDSLEEININQLSLFQHY